MVSVRDGGVFRTRGGGTGFRRKHPSSISGSGSPMFLFLGHLHIPKTY